MRIIQAERQDCGAILALQYLAYQSEAKLLQNDDIPPLRQTLEEVEQEHQDGTMLKAVDEDGALVGSVRGHMQGDTFFIGKLIVHPTQQKKGIGRRLLAEIERLHPGLRYELFTSDKSARNLEFYERAGYTKCKEVQIMPTLKFIYLEKR